MRAQKTQTEIRKEQILRAALEMIAEKGVYALSITGIAERVGIVCHRLCTAILRARMTFWMQFWVG